MLHSPEARTGDNTATCDATLHRGIAEVEAESVALMIGAAHGLDTSAYSVGYVAGWSKCEAGTIKATAANVLRTAHALADAITEPDAEPVAA